MTTRYMKIDESAGTAPEGQYVESVSIDGLGDGGSSYVLPAASAGAIGGVKLAALSGVSDANASVASAAAETVTKAEFDALVTAYNALAASHNALIDALQASGALATA